MQYFQLENLNYSFEELEFLKLLTKYPDDGQRALDIMSTGVEEYYHPRLENILKKFLKDGIWDFYEDKKGKYHSTFHFDLKETIINHPNPIPEKYKKDVDTGTILEKLSCSNLDISEVNYIRALLKNDLINQPQKL